MAKRKIIKINEDTCTGCGECIPNCPEGALQLIDGKARLISDIFCDGLGACLGHCPEGAITIEEREAAPYDERKAMENIVKAGKNTIIAHLQHLKDHGETTYLNEALAVLREKGIEVDFDVTNKQIVQLCNCPGAQMVEFSPDQGSSQVESGTHVSQLRQWPVQLRLVSPTAPYFQEQDLLLVADCVAYAMADFHKEYLTGKRMAIACPKLDADPETYIEKLVALIDEAKITSFTVMIMEVPCCRGLLYLAQQAVDRASRKIPIKLIVVDIKGTVLKEETL